MANRRKRIFMTAGERNGLLKEQLRLGKLDRPSTQSAEAD
jgi:hypothetical protein